MGHRRAGKLAVLAHHQEPVAQVQGQRRGHKEAPRFDAGQKVRLMGFDQGGQPLDGMPPSLRVGEQRRDVVEQDAGRREIGYLADVILKLDRGHVQSFASLNHSPEYSFQGRDASPQGISGQLALGKAARRHFRRASSGLNLAMAKRVKTVKLTLDGGVGAVPRRKG